MDSSIVSYRRYAAQDFFLSRLNASRAGAAGGLRRPNIRMTVGRNAAVKLLAPPMIAFTRERLFAWVTKGIGLSERVGDQVVLEIFASVTEVSYRSVCAMFGFDSDESETSEQMLILNVDCGVVG